jgi:ligand-binding sensor domain-containing protein
MAISPSGEFYQYIDESLPQVEGRKQRYVQLLNDGTVMVSSEVGLTFIKNHEIVSTLKCGEELQNGTVLNAVECEDGTLLLGSDGAGVEVLKQGKVEKIITKDDGLCSSVILRIIKDRVGDGYFVMTGSGVCYMSPDYKVRELTGIPFFNNYDISFR